MLSSVLLTKDAEAALPHSKGQDAVVLPSVFAAFSSKADRSFRFFFFSVPFSSHHERIIHIRLSEEFAEMSSGSVSING